MIPHFRKRLIQAATFLGGAYFVLEFLFPEGAITSPVMHDQITNGFITVGAAAFLLGVLNIFFVHGRKILFFQSGWFPSTMLILGLITMMVVTSLDWWSSKNIGEQTRRFTILSDFLKQIDSDRTKNTEGVPPVSYRMGKFQESSLRLFDEVSESPLSDQGSLRSSLQMLRDQVQTLPSDPSSAQLMDVEGNLVQVAGVYGGILRSAQATQLSKKLNDFLIKGIFSPLAASMFALLAFFMATAAFRAFRIRSVEAFLMMAAATFVILGQTPFGPHIYEDLPSVRLWLLEIPNGAAIRAIKIGASVAGLIIAIRMWFSIEAESFSEPDSLKPGDR